MAHQASLAVKAGIVIILGLILLLWFSLQSSGRGWFNKGYELIAEFDTAKGLEHGSPVALAGVPIGQVSSIDIDQKRARVRLHLQINKPYVVTTDAVGTIRLKTLLGNYQLYLTPGTPGGPTLPPNATLRTEEFRDVTDVLQDLGKLTNGPDSLFASVNKNQQRLFAQIDQVIAENRNNLHSTTGALAQAAPKFNELLDSLNLLSKNIKEGRGTLGKLASDDQLYTQIMRIAGNVEQFSGNLNHGQGALNRLINDQALGQKVDVTFDNVNAAAGKVRGLIDRNESSLDQAIHAAGSALPKLDQSMGHFAAIGAKINHGEGTLGKLVNDPALYNSMRDAIGQVRRTFEEGEEQGVMRTFLAVFFGSVI